MVGIFKKFLISELLYSNIIYVMKQVDIEQVIKILDKTYSSNPMLESYLCKPYKALVSCILSLRTRDEVTYPIAEELFKIADTPQAMIELPYEELCKIIKSINYYKTKAENIQLNSKIILEKYEGIVPDSMDELLSLRGVGRKTANIVLAVGYGQPAIAVDTHVHRISNRLGFVSTRTPDETELVLREKVPKKLWRDINRLFVMHGKTTCKPIGPTCGKCPVFDLCNRVGVL